MTITPQNILRHELIGLSTRVLRATDPNVVGVRGIVVDETRNTITISNRRRKVMIPKGVSTFRFDLPNGVRVDVDGSRLVAKPENRLKTRVRRW